MAALGISEGINVTRVCGRRASGTGLLLVGDALEEELSSIRIEEFGALDDGECRVSQLSSMIWESNSAASLPSFEWMAGRRQARRPPEPKEIKRDLKRPFFFFEFAAIVDERDAKSG